MPLTWGIGLGITDGAGRAGGASIPANAMLWPDGSTMLWPDGSIMLWPT